MRPCQQRRSSIVMTRERQSKVRFSMLAFVSVKFEHCVFHLRHYFSLHVSKHSCCVLACESFKKPVQCYNMP